MDKEVVSDQHALRIGGILLLRDIQVPFCCSLCELCKLPCGTMSREMDGISILDCIGNQHHLIWTGLLWMGMSGGTCFRIPFQSYKCEQKDQKNHWRHAPFIEVPGVGSLSGVLAFIVKPQMGHPHPDRRILEIRQADVSACWQSMADQDPRCPGSYNLKRHHGQSVVPLSLPHWRSTGNAATIRFVSIQEVRRLQWLWKMFRDVRNEHRTG